MLSVGHYASDLRLCKGPELTPAYVVPPGRFRAPVVRQARIALRSADYLAADGGGNPGEGEDWRGRRYDV